MSNKNTKTNKRGSHSGKGGRPKVSQEDKLKSVFSTRLDEYDTMVAEAKMKESGLNRSEFTRAGIVGVQVTQALPPESFKDRHSIAEMGNNINQLAHRANAAGYRHDEKLLRDVLPQIKDLLHNIRMRFRNREKV